MTPSPISVIRQMLEFYAIKTVSMGKVDGVEVTLDKTIAQSALEALTSLEAQLDAAEKMAEMLDNLKRQNNHTIAEEEWRIDEALDLWNASRDGER
jgi:hypothetical protein